MPNSVLNYYLKIARAADRFFWSENAVQRRPAFIKYGFAILLLIGATFFKIYFFLFIGNQTPFLLYFAVVILSTAFGGVGPGVFTTLLSSLITCYLFQEPYHQFRLNNSQALQLLAFISESLFLIALSGAVTRANRHVKRSAERFRALIENIHDAIMVIDADGKILYVSPTVEPVLGYPKGEFETIDYRSIINENDLEELQKKYLRMLEDNNQSFSVQCRVRHKNGSWTWVEGTFANLLDHPSVKGVVCNFRNITERVFLEKQKDDFISIATHELKTPVTSIKAYAQILLKRFNKDRNEPAVSMIEKMDGQLNKLIVLISDLLDVTKIEGGRLQLHEEFYEFNELVKELVEELQRTTDEHKIIVNLSHDIKIYGDKERIGQVFTNLITNAIKYSPSPEDIIVSTFADNDGVTVCVEDKGVGISKENLEKIFERFYRVSGPENQTFPGLGLGLYISNEIVQRQGGKMWVESEKDKGSTFCFCLPTDYRVKTRSLQQTEQNTSHVY